MATQTFDTSDIDQYLGQPIESSQLREPIAANDIRRWVHAMHYPNRLHYDPDFAGEGRWGGLIAPQSFAIACDDGHGAAPACVGRIPESHLLFGGDEWFFNDVQIRPGDRISVLRVPYDYTVKDTGFAGPTCFQRGDNIYTNQHGEEIARQRSTAIRYSAAAGGASTDTGNAQDPRWSPAELEALEERKFTWIQGLHDLGHKPRYWDEVKVGDVLPERVFGPHSLASFATEWRAFYMSIWGAFKFRKQDLEAMGFTREMAGYENDPDMVLVNPELTDGAYIGPSRGHLNPEWARKIGMPRGYGYGASMGSWITDYLAGWAGEHGRVVHSIANYRGPALTGDITIQTAEVTEKSVTADGTHLVHVKHRMENQLGTVMATGSAEIALPARPGGAAQ